MAADKVRDSRPTQKRADVPRQSRPVWVCLIAIALTVLVWCVFGQTLRYDFINFDDDRYVYAEPHVSHGITIDGLKWMWTHSHASLWHPLTTLSHMIDCQLWGLRPGGHHFTNVFLHSIAVVLLFLVLRSMTGSVWRSAFVTTVFAVHPMRVESVAWVAERKDILSAVFFMLTLAGYLRYVRNPTVWRYIGVSIIVACGLMSKATFVTVPIVLLLLDYWPLGRRGWRWLLLEKIPWLVLAAGASVATLLAQRVTMPSLEQLPLLPRFKNAAVSIVIYILRTFWPVNLAVFYPHPHDQLRTSVVLGSATFVFGMSLLALALRRSRPYVFVGWFWYLIVLLPVLGIVQAGLQGHADRFTYLANIGLSVAVVWTVGDWARSWRYSRQIMIPAVAVVIIALVICSWWQATYWRDSISLWRRTLAVTSNNQIAHQNLAAALWQLGQKDEAKMHSRRAVIIHWETAVKDYPFDVNSHNELGVALIQDHDAHAAIENWETTLQIDPSNGNAENNLAWVLATYPDGAVRNGTRAVELAKKAVALPGGDNPIVMRTLAAAYAERGDFSQAVETAQRAAELASARQNGSLAETLNHEMSLYRAGQPYRELPPQ